MILYPQTAVGIFNALTGDLLTTDSTPDLLEVLARFPKVLAWNWINLLVFNVANQRLSNSIVEDSFNKPWRPLPSGRISPNGSRRLLLSLIPSSTFIILMLGGVPETATMLVLTWMYNDLGGADENYVIRNLINAAGFMCHGSGSTAIAAGNIELASRAYIWLAMIGGVVFSTLQVQDIPDMEGDAARGRRTLPLVHGQRVGRWSVAVPVGIWSLLCPAFWGAELLGYVLPVAVGGLVVIRTLTLRNVTQDHNTYKIWCLWLTILYALPLCNNHDVFVRFWQHSPLVIRAMELLKDLRALWSLQTLPSSLQGWGTVIISLPACLVSLPWYFR